MHGQKNIKLRNLKSLFKHYLKQPSQINNCELCDVCSTDMCNKFTHIFSWEQNSIKPSGILKCSQSRV